MPTIAELERMIDEQGESVQILPNGEIVERKMLVVDPPPRGNIVMAGDEHAAIYWTGERWSYDKADAKVYGDWREAKRTMSTLRDSSGTTIRTQHVGHE